MQLLVFYTKQIGTNQIMIRMKLKTNSTAELKHANLMILRKVKLKNSNKEGYFNLSLPVIAVTLIVLLHLSFILITQLIYSPLVAIIIWEKT